MQNITKIISIWLVLVSGISFAETVRERIANNSIEENLSIEKVIDILGNSDHKYPNDPWNASNRRVEVKYIKN